MALDGGVDFSLLTNVFLDLTRSLQQEYLKKMKSAYERIVFAS